MYNTTSTYRIIDCDDDSIVANGIPTNSQAAQVLEQYQINYPDCEFIIESYNTNSPINNK